jgi:prepilin-type N-terminal cleavage/methylation domain-containing protein
MTSGFCSARRPEPGITSESGFSLLELLVSTAIMLIVTGAIFSLMNPAQGTAQVQPEVADLQQRMRVGADTMFKELVMGGAGPYSGSSTGSLIKFFAPILPRRTGRISPDPYTTARTDAITISYIPNSYSQTTITSSMPNVSAELKVADQQNCPRGQQLCGFTDGMEVIIFDTTGNFDVFTITNVQADAGHLQHRGQDLSFPYTPGASVTQVRSLTFYLDRTTNQLRQYDGGSSDVPLVDNVVDLRFDYFGDPNPPLAPKPPAGIDNCLYDDAGNYDSGMVTLTPNEGSLAALPYTMLNDGPWCGGGGNRYDADLLRVRKVRVTLRMQVASASLRGTDRTLFANPGGSLNGQKSVPDYLVRFDVSPRNLNLSR